MLSPVPVDVVCCAGLAPVHGDSCCEGADDNALARSCCDGGDSSVISHSKLRVAPPAVVLARPIVPATLSPRGGTLPRRLVRPHPPDSGLFTLHSAFLI